MLKQEQEEYAREGIQWTPIKYFNNRVICELVDAPHQGIIAIMDEACLNPTKVQFMFLNPVIPTHSGDEYTSFYI